jgi:tape measure domain-containing protein
MAQDLKFKFSSDDAELMRSFDRIQKRMQELDSNQNKLERSSKGLGDSVGNFLKGYLAVSAVVGAGKAFLDATASANKFEAQLNAASDTQADFAKNTAFLERLADKYNKNIIDLGQNFAQLSIATKGTNLEGEKTERLFAAVTAASATLKMSVDDTNGTFRAFIQMVSKGNVQAEELRGQLGERLYGAFGLAAKSMGVTTAELNKMLEKGEVLASDLLPKLTTELETTFGAKAAQNANNLGSNIDYATGQLTLLFAEFGKTSGITGGLNSMAESMGEIFSWLRKLNTESGVARGFFDRMLTLPGSSLKGGKAGSKYETIEELSARLQKDFNAVKGDTAGPQSTTDTSAYGRQYDIRETNPKAEAKIKQQNEQKAREAEQIINKWVREQIEASQQRIADALADMSLQRTLDDRKFNGVLGPMQSMDRTGTTTTHTRDDSFDNFSSPVTGDGSATNYDNIIANMSATIDKAIAEQNRFKNATEDFGKQLDESIKASLGTALMDVTQLIGQIAGSLATGTFDLADAGNAFLGIMATLFDNIGKALSAYAASVLLADLAIGSMNPVGALAGAALAFAAGAAARASMQDSSASAFYAGGIAGNGMVQGRGGVDKVPAMLSPGEMVFNKSQQRNMWGLINGAYSGAGILGSNNMGGRGDHIDVTVNGRLRAGDINISNNVGDSKNRYFSGKRRA